MIVTLYKPDYVGPLSAAGRVTAALAEGLRTLGVPHEVRHPKDFDGEVSDIAIVNGWLKKDIDRKCGSETRNRNRVIEAQQAAGKPTWCIERGFLGDRAAWSSISIDGYCATGGDFRAEDMPGDRWAKLGIELKPWRIGPQTNGKPVLLCAQVPWDAQVDDGNHLAWLERTAREIRRHTDRPIVFRPHPKAYRRGYPYADLSLEFLELVEPVNLDRPPEVPFEDQLAEAHAVVCFNSNVATLSIVAGVPAFTGARSLADPMACRDLTFIDYPPRWNRTKWANDLAYKQWHIDEFREGLPWLHLTRP